METNPADRWQPLLGKLTQLKASWPAPAWSWDRRFCTLGASFRGELAGRARASVAHLLPLEWTHETIADAPDKLRELAEQTGGLRAGQLVFGAPWGPELRGLTPYGLWWPWGGGDTITLRLGLLGLEADADPFPRVRGLFGVSVR